jgi:hypothetical protein
MVILSGVLIALSIVLVAAGFFGGAGFVYAALALSLVAAGLLPVGAVRRLAGVRCPPTDR